MTIREYYQTVLDAHISEDMDKASSTLLSKLDERNEKRKSADTKEKKEAAARRAAVLTFLSDHKGEQFTREALAAAVSTDECIVSPAQAQAACKGLGEAVSKTEVKIDKARKVVYSLAE